MSTDTPEEDRGAMLELLDGRTITQEQAEREGIRGPGWVCPKDGWVNLDVRIKCRHCGAAKPQLRTSSEVIFHQVGRMTLAALQDRIDVCTTTQGRLAIELVFTRGHYEAKVYDSTPEGIARVKVASGTGRTFVEALAKALCRAGLLVVDGIHPGDLAG